MKSARQIIAELHGSYVDADIIINRLERSGYGIVQLGRAYPPHMSAHFIVFNNGDTVRM